MGARHLGRRASCFFELLTGYAPFSGRSINSLRDVVLSLEPATFAAEARPDLPEEANAIAQRAMRKTVSDASARPTSCSTRWLRFELALHPRHASQSRVSRAVVADETERRQTTVLS